MGHFWMTTGGLTVAILMAWIIAFITNLLQA